MRQLSSARLYRRLGFYGTDVGKAAAESADKGLQGIVWSLLNTREFSLQH